MRASGFHTPSGGCLPASSQRFGDSSIVMRTSYRRRVFCSAVRPAAVTIAASLFALSISAVHAEALHRLKGAEIRQQFTGKILTDRTHWKETYAAGGRFIASEMGHGTTTGTWRVDGDRLCKTLPDLPNACYDVWGAGNRMELRYGQATAQQGVLQPAATR